MLSTCRQCVCDSCPTVIDSSEDIGEKMRENTRQRSTIDPWSHLIVKSPSWSLLISLGFFLMIWPPFPGCSDLARRRVTFTPVPSRTRAERPSGTSPRSPFALKSKMAVAYKQELPPKGGYPPIEYARNLPKRGASGAVMLLAGAAVMAGGFALVIRGNRRRW